MIQLYIAIGLLGLLYFNNKDKQEKETEINNEINNEIKKIETFDDSFPESIKQINTDSKYSESFIEKNASNKNPTKKSLTKRNNSLIPIDEFKGSGSLLNPYTKSEQLTKENFLQRKDGYIPVPDIDNNRKGTRADLNAVRGKIKLEKFTGRGENNFKKTETTSFFKPTKNLSFINGTPNITQFEKERLQTSTIRNGELPFEQIKVGSGIGEEYGNKPRGGFHQFNIQEIATPKNIDQLRSKNNQKNTYKGVVIKGKNSNDKRTILGNVQKLTPDTFYLNNEDRYFKTTGANLKESKRLNFDAKYTNRTKSRHFMGNAKPDIDKHKLNPDVKKSTRNIYKNYGVRNGNKKTKWSSVNKMSDYGKHTFITYANERDVTQQRTYKSNFNTLVKSIISPLLDKFKKTRKENVIGNKFPEGNMGLSIPKKMTVHDSNDIAKTTIKETLIHNKREGNIKVQGPEKCKTYDYDTLPKITIRNTLKDVDTSVNLTPNKPGKAVLFTNQPIKATIKETTSKNKYHGQPQYTKSDGYKVAKVKASNTNRQFTSDHEYKGIAGCKDKLPTNLDNYKNASLNINKELISRGRHPTKTGSKKFIGGKDLTIQNKKRMSETKNIKPRKGTKFVKGPERKIMTAFKDKLSTQNRNNPEILDSLKTNPYNQPFNSFTHGTEFVGTHVNLSKKNDYDSDMNKETELEKRILEEINKL